MNIIKISKLHVIVVTVIIVCFIIYIKVKSEQIVTTSTTLARNEMSGTFDSSRDIVLVTRELGSGDRIEFCKHFGLYNDENAFLSDLISTKAKTEISLDEVIDDVATNKYAVSYMPIGEITSDIKAVSIDGVEPTMANVISRKYTLRRPITMNSLYKPTATVKDFINFVMSQEGQKIISKKHVPISNYNYAKPFQSKVSGGHVTISGSSSMEPLMNELISAYRKHNELARIEYKESNSSAGILDAIEGNCDIGISSRELNEKEKEKEKLISHIFAIDGMAVVVNESNILDDLSREEVVHLFRGTERKWSNFTQQKR